MFGFLLIERDYGMVTAMSGTRDAYQHGLDKWRAMGDFQLTLIDAIGRFKARCADKLVREIAMENDPMVVRMKKTSLRQVESSYKKLLRERQRKDIEARTIGSQASNAGLLFLGEDLAAGLVPSAWGGYRFFYELVPQSVKDTLLHVAIDPAARTGSNFSYNQDRERQCDDVPPQSRNVIELLGWMATESYVPRVGGKAQVQLVNVMSRLAAVAQSRLDEQELRYAELQAGDHTSWNPMTITTLPVSQAEADTQT